MTLLKPALILALLAGLAACSPATIAPYGDGAAPGPGASRAARTPGELTELDIIRVVQSSL
jgi:hypothetical protein